MSPFEEKINSVQTQLENFEENISGDIESFRLKYISKKSAVSELFEELKTLSKEEKQKSVKRSTT